MTRDRRPGPTGFDAFAEIGKRLGDLAEHLKGVLDSEQSEAGEQSGQRTFTIDTPKGPLTGVAGYSVRFGGVNLGGNLGGTSVDNAIKRNSGNGFGSPKTAPTDVETIREPLVDIHDEVTRIVVTAELPGVQIEDVTVQINGRALVIETHSSKRFRSSITLPADVEASTLATSLRNGILQATVEKAVKTGAP
jgi:HSP20 family protein